MPDGAQLEVVAGQGNSWLVTPKRQGQAITLAGTETLAATLHRGGTRTVVVTLTANHSAGKALVAISGAQSTGLDGYYVVNLTIDQVAQRIGRLRVLPAPGLTATRPVYGTMADIRRIASTWVDKLLSDYDELDLNPQLADAKEWLEERVLERTPSWQRRTVATYLADGKLLVTQRVREITARVALAWLCEGQMGSSIEEDQEWRARARWQHERVKELLGGWSAGIDTDADGVADYFPGVSAPLRLVR